MGGLPGKGENRDLEKGSDLLPGPKGRKGFSGGFVLVFGRNEKVAPGMQNVRSRGGLGFGEQKVHFCHVTELSSSLG